MSCIEAGANVAQDHAPLAQRAAGVLGTLAGDETIVLRDAHDRSPLPPRCTAIHLLRATSPGVVRDGSRRFTLRYIDGGSEATLAALLACAARPGAPIAADPESLSILALAERLGSRTIAHGTVGAVDDRVAVQITRLS